MVNISVCYDYTRTRTCEFGRACLAIGYKHTLITLLAGVHRWMVKRISKVEFTLTSEDDQMALLATSYLNRKDKLLDEHSTTTKASSEIKKKDRLRLTRPWRLNSTNKDCSNIFAFYLFKRLLYVPSNISCL